MTSQHTDRPAVMRAVSQDRFGGPEVLRLTERPVPEPGPSQVLVRVHAAGLNPTDWKHRSGRRFLGDPPYVLGWDVSGVVERVGIGVTLFEPGDEVFGMLPYPHGAGSFADYVTAPTRALVRKPVGIGHVEAAGVPLAALTAWQALVDTAGLAEGQRVLVHAAAGGVGHLAVQIAVARGARVVGTASEGKHEFVLGLGAEEVIDYRAVDFAAELDGLDVVLDTVGGDYGVRSLDTLRPGGTLVTTLPVGQEEAIARARERGMRAAAMLVEHDHAGMSAVADLVSRGLLKAHISEVFPLSRIADAHRAGETGHTTGKIVVDVAGG
ncbi:NADP-dependent oxidoreductase [Streptomonospora nanhaiensis]|uniref:NADP-dependent oxidoreductase n=1 Tax=Streptomonospora nanhaiensis TaxID=1323731 RepID=UPI001FEA9242|nr:NADP-dependent oxidoreductase [Streptomonospora nanhaiensis]